MIGDIAREIVGLAYHSRVVQPGFLFFAISGFKVDGNKFAEDALGCGAVAVVSERSFSDVPVVGGTTAAQLDRGLAWVRVTDARASMAGISANFYAHPSQQLQLVGVTGTNGKTTTAFLLDSIFRSSGARAAMMGTIEQRLGEERSATEHTTPESPDIQQFLRRAVDAGCRFASMEVSSHALKLRRSDALDFRAAIFTNLTQDHLDFHGTLENYYASKQRFFLDSDFGNPICVINRDDSYGERLWKEVTRRKVGYGLDSRNDFHPSKLSCTQGGISFRLAGRADFAIESALVGAPNVYNILGACAAAFEIGVDPSAIQEGIRNLQLVPGRMERVPNNRGLNVFVDYAHTDDALKNVLQLARPFTGGRLILLFGCGGDRDRTKRPLMGKAAARYADLVVLTSDNPRTEDPEAILDQIEPTLEASDTQYARIENRREAIRYAINQARREDTVILAGKGHEEYQIVGTDRIPFSDREEARAALEGKR
ncbi:MAG TPA: UDP-N-acetylmuramoyl-L-alanyl-D-glutamate--2,6-diaminopimelate ligase [Acidobacteriota bacterium]|nr:UDP-N-acetylmuramoyl-L-alanyl-D-glutamate--2,6-diaminopimelate ligase [Acidobacteriota bacterium]